MFQDTGVVPPADVDVVMVAPKGSGFTLRTLFLEGRGLNSSVAVHQVRVAEKGGIYVLGCLRGKILSVWDFTTYHKQIGFK